MLKTKIFGLPQGQALLVFDAAGKMIGHSREFPTPKVNAADRDYFASQKDMATDRLFISQPLRNRVNGRWMVSLSRHFRIPGSEGFGGAVMAAIEVEYFTRLYRALNLPDGVSIVLQRLDGVTLVVHPWEDGAAPPTSVLGSIAGAAPVSTPEVGGRPVLAARAPSLPRVSNARFMARMSAGSIMCVPVEATGWRRDRWCAARCRNAHPRRECG